MSPALAAPLPEKIGVKRWIGAATGFLLLAVLMAAAVTFSFDAAAQRRRAEGWYVHTLNVLLVAGQLKTAVNDARQRERGFLLTDDPKFRRPEGRDEMARLVTQLRQLTRDNPRQQKTLAELQRRIGVDEGATLALVAASRGDGAVSIAGSGVGGQHVEAVQALLGEIEAEEHRLLVARQSANEAANARLDLYNHVLAALGAAFLAFGAGAGAAAYHAHRGELRSAGELRRLATTDELTGLANRRHLLAQLDIEAARARRSGAPLALALLDIDHFKQVNDRYGHAVGDEVLRIFGEMAVGLVRPGDLIGRIGGEEFALVMPGVDPEHAMAICRRISEAMAKSEILLPQGGAARVTLSAGVAQAIAGEPAPGLIARADRALYRAKKTGRNRVCRAAPPASGATPSSDTILELS